MSSIFQAVEPVKYAIMEEMEGETKPNIAGQPTKWTPEINDRIIEYFDVDASELIYDTKGKPYQTMRKLMPTFEGFAHEIDVDGDTLVEWAKPEYKDKYVGYSAAYARAKALQKRFVLQAGMNGAANPQFAIFFAKNNLGMKDKTETDVTSNGNTINVMTFGASDPLATAINKTNEHSVQLDASASPASVHGQSSEVQGGGVAPQVLEDLNGDQRAASLGDDSSGDVLVRGSVPEPS